MTPGGIIYHTLASLGLVAQADADEIGSGGLIITLIAVGLFLIFIVLAYVASRYKRCPSNRILVIWGRGRERSARCYHGGGKIVLPVVEDYAYLSLEPLVIEIPLEGALSLNNIRVNVPSTFTVGISTDPVMMNNAAERLLGLAQDAVREQAQDIILGQLRLVIATLSIEEINKDREKFMGLINENVTEEINKIGLELINVNIRDITDESGYIRAIGQRAAAEAINTARVEVAQADRDGATGEAIAKREMTVNVAKETASAVEGEKQAEQRQRVAVAQLEAQAITGEAESRRDQDIVVAQRGAETIAAQKQAEQEQRVRVAEAEAAAVGGENESSAKIAESNARLAEIRAEARRRSDVAAAQAAEAILRAEREQELALLAKTELAPQEIEKERIEIAAEAEAEKTRREARGEADAILARYNAEAEGVRKVLEAKADGYRSLIDAAKDSPQLAPTFLLIEQLPELVREQVRAIQNLKIDKITVWDSGRNGSGSGGSTTDFLSGMIGALPPVHELARQAGVELPGYLGKVGQGQATDNPDQPAKPGDASGAKPEAKPANKTDAKRSGPRQDH